MRIFACLSLYLSLGLMTSQLSAQYISPNNSKGQTKTVEERKTEEFKNNQNKYTPKPTKSTSGSTPAANPVSKPKTEAEVEQAHKAFLEAEAAKKIAERKAASLLKDQNKQAFIKKVAQYNISDYSFYDKGLYTPFTINGKHGFLSIEGVPLFEPVSYDALSTRVEWRMAWVKSGNKFGFIDIDGKLVVSVKYDSVYDFKINTGYGKPIALVKLNGKYGYINNEGYEIIRIIYDELEVNPCCNLYAAKLNGKWGFVSLDREAKDRIPFNFNEIFSKFQYPDVMTAKNSNWYHFNLNSATATVVKGKAKYIINTEGNVVGNKFHKITGEILTDEDILEKGSFTDNGNNKIYQTIIIGKHVWMAQNLDNDRFANGDIIPEANSEREWKKAEEQGKPAWCYYDKDPENGKKFGKLYNWYAVNDHRGLAPEGWLIPDNSAWQIMLETAGGNDHCGPNLKQPGIWYNGDKKKFNESGFSALPGGTRTTRYKKIEFADGGKDGYWWSSSVLNDNGPRPYFYIVVDYIDPVFEKQGYVKGEGFSVRCIKKDN